MSPQADATTAAARPRLRLSAKLLGIMVFSMMLTDLLVFVPTVANFRLNWLNDRLSAAYTAALVLEAAPSGMVSESLAREILKSVGAKAVAIKMGTHRSLLAASEPPGAIHHDIDMRSVPWSRAVIDAFEAFFCPDGTLMRVVGPAPMGGEYIEVIMEEKPLREAMWRFAGIVLLLSLAISTGTSALVYFALHRVFVRPLSRMTDGMMAFRREPENLANILVPSERRDELGFAERELAAMQTDIASMLNQKSRLVALGLAVSKINHDLRNLLASAQLISDRLASVQDPTVQRFAPKLMRALERAIDFCRSTLSYGRAQEPPPERRMLLLQPLADEVEETLGLGPDTPIRWIGAVEQGLRVDADPDQLFRILLNLGRNAVQVLESRAPNHPARDQIRLTGRRQGATAVIELSDTGPGVPERARANLFAPFQGSTRTGGSGLGLAIASELVHAHGGDIHLVEGTIGATFRITIPDRAVELGAQRRRARA